MAKKSLLWKIPLAVAGVAFGSIILLLGAVVCVLYVPAVRTAVVEKGVAVANEKTDYNIHVDGLYLSPFHHSPKILYQAWKGKVDLPIEVRIDSTFVGHRGQDTLLYVHALRLRAIALTSQAPLGLETPIVVEELYIDTTTFHSGSMIGAVGIDAIVGRLAARSPGIVIAEGQYPLRGLQIAGTYVGIDLRNTHPDTTAKDTVPMKMAFDLPDAELSNLRFRLTPLGLDVHTRSLSTNALVDVGANTYDVHRIEIGKTAFAIGTLQLPIDTLHGNVCVNLDKQLITSSGLHVRSDEIGAKADLSATEMSLETMRVEVAGVADYQGSQVRLNGYYDIDDEAYDMHVDIDKVNLAAFVPDATNVVIEGKIDAQGKGINPNSRAMQSKLDLHLTEAQYNNIQVSGMRLNAELADQAVRGTLHLPVAMRDKDLQVSANTNHLFRVAQFMQPEQMSVDYHAGLQRVRAKVAGMNFRADSVQLDFATDSATALALTTEGIGVKVQSPMHVLKLVDRVQTLLKTAGDSAVIKAITSLSDLSHLDTIHRLMPDMQADIALAKGSPAQFILDSAGIDLKQAVVSLRSDSMQTLLTLNATTNNQTDSTTHNPMYLRLPAANASARVMLAEGKSVASVAAKTSLDDGAMMVHNLQSETDLWVDIERTGEHLNGEGCLMMDNLMFNDMDLGSREIDIAIAPSERYDNAIRADVQLDDIPLEIVDSIIQMADLDLKGAIRAKASADGLPKQLDLTAEVLPVNVAAQYKPYEVGLSLGNQPIVMEHNQVDLNGLRIYGADSTFLALNGGLDLDSMRLNVVLEADSFAPVKMPQGGKLPVYGELATDIHGTVTGALDNILVNADVTVLPTTDITYPIDQKNLAQVKPHGTVHVRFATAEKEPLSLRGQLNVDEGKVKYSPKVYPMMPFNVDKGSKVVFNGGLGSTLLDVSASQEVKADVQAKGEPMRTVDFRTGVRINSTLDSIGVEAVEFFLEAPRDEAISEELASVDEGTREGYAATLLATGMYMGESNEAAKKDGYALSSIINSRINAAMVNSKRGKVVDISVRAGEMEHGNRTSNDLNVAISKSFFKNRLKISVGATMSDAPEANSASSFYYNASADYRLTKDSAGADVFIRAFTQRDYNNVLEGDLFKSGLGVRTTKYWDKTTPFKYPKKPSDADSITRTYSLVADADVAWRSNNSIGPNLTLTSSVRNLMGRGETFSIKGNGAYYWALRNRHPGDPKKTDTYKLGVNAALTFPYLHWVGDNNPDGDTRYMLGYQYENIAGGYGVHKLSGSFTYFIQTSKYITHAFTPFSLSIVLMKAESEDLLDKAAEYPQLIKIFAGNEFVPSIGYNFIYNNYRSKRTVNTMLNLGVKESGNLINALYCAFGHKWNDKNKPLGSITFNQFVKLTAELRNKYNITDQVCIATRFFAGANIPLGNSIAAPLSEAFYAGGANGMRAASPYAYGPGAFHSPKYNQSFFHAGDVKLEANFELRFPIVWKLYGATFVDAGNVWNWYNSKDIMTPEEYSDMATKMQLPDNLYDGLHNNPDFLKQIALGTGAGLRLDIEGLVIRFDLGVAIHAPYQTYRYDKQGKPDYTRPINNYFNLPSGWDVLRLNFGIGYPF